MAAVQSPSRLARDGAQPRPLIEWRFEFRPANNALVPAKPMRWPARHGGGRNPRIRGEISCLMPIAKGSVRICKAASKSFVDKHGMQTSRQASPRRGRLYKTRMASRDAGLRCAAARTRGRKKRRRGETSGAPAPTQSARRPLRGIPRGRPPRHRTAVVRPITPSPISMHASRTWLGHGRTRPLSQEGI